MQKYSDTASNQHTICVILSLFLRKAFPVRPAPTPAGHPSIPNAEGAATCPVRISVALPCTLNRRKTRLMGQQHALYAPLWHIPAPSAAEILD